VTPAVYTNLIGVSLIDGSIAVGEPTDEATELVIVMNRMNMDDVLFERLMQNGVSLDEAYQLGKSSAENLARIRKSPAPDLNYYQESGDRIADLYNWLASSTEKFEKGETERYMNFLEQYRVEHKEHFTDVLSTELEFGGDIHSHNALVTGNELLLMDTFSPKAAWRVEHHSVPAYRLATDLWALGGTKEHFDRFLQGYQEVSGKIIDRALDAFFTVYASLIAVPYHYMLAKNDVSKRVAAERFHTFLRNYFSKI
jgi:aminoglycoside phosphotransferase family enzyme